MLKFDHVALSVTNVDESVKFYEKLEFSLSQRWDDPHGNLSIVLMKNSNMILEMFCYKNFKALPEYRQELSSDLEVIGTKHFGLCVEDINVAAKTLSEKEICINPKIAQGRLGRDYFFIKDPDGVLIEIIQEH